MLASDVYKRIRFVMGAETDNVDSLPSATSPQDIANEAGTILTGLHGWNFLSGRMALLDIIKGQDWIELPSDFQSLEDVRAITSTYNITILGTGARLSEVDVFESSNPYYFTAIVSFIYEDTEDSQGNAISKRGAVPVLRLAPTPGADALQTTRVYYQAGWRDLTDDGDAVDLPKFMEPLYLELCGEYARGLIAREDGLVGDRVARLVASPLFETCRRVDSGMQPNYGIVRNGVGWNAGILHDPNFYSDVAFIS